MEKIEPLEHGKFYHVYNRGINKSDVFFEYENYEHFIRLYENHISPIAETYAWCLMKNHFHFLVRIKEEHELQETKSPHQYFSNLFNAYTKAINKKYNRHSSLFQRTFKRKLVDDETYLKKLILYIHNNPVNHGICDNAMDYPWSSYLTHLSQKETKLKRKETINLFENLANFKTMHSLQHDSEVIESSIEF